MKIMDFFPLPLSSCCLPLVELCAATASKCHDALMGDAQVELVPSLVLLNILLGTSTYTNNSSE